MAGFWQWWTDNDRVSGGSGSLGSGRRHRYAAGMNTLALQMQEGIGRELYIVLKNQRQDIDHLSVSALFAQHVILQLAEGIRHFCKRRAIAKGPGLTLDNSEIVVPIIDDLAGLAMGSLNNPGMLAHRLPLSDDDQPFGVHV